VGAYGANMAARRLRRRLRSLFDQKWSKRKWSKKWSKNTIFKVVEFDQKWSKKKGMLPAREYDQNPIISSRVDGMERSGGEVLGHEPSRCEKPMMPRRGIICIATRMMAL